MLLFWGAFLIYSSLYHIALAMQFACSALALAQGEEEDPVSKARH